MDPTDRLGLDAALAEARAAAADGGVPIGAALVVDGTTVAKGIKRRAQSSGQILHGEMACLENAGRRRDRAKATLCTRLSPCMIRAGTVVRARIPRVVIGENCSFGGNEGFLPARGMDVGIAEDAPYPSWVHQVIQTSPEIWNQDTGT